jgi:hypothetical protein
MLEVYVECYKNRNQAVRRYSDGFPKMLKWMFLLVLKKIRVFQLGTLPVTSATSNQTVQAMLRKHKFKSYIPQKVQVLEENDRSRREQFCNVYLNMLQLVSDRNHVFSRNRNRISSSVTVSAETETFEFSYFLDTDLCVLSREKNAGRQCHFKIWLDCHKCWGSSSIDLLSGGSSCAWESKEILEQF